MKIDDDTVTFSSGRTAYVNCGIVGLGPDLAVYGGYDQVIRWPPCEPTGDGGLTTAELRELAEHMIAEWTRFASILGASEG